MILLDVNVLVDGFREDAPRHAIVRPWLEQTIRSESAFAVADLVLSGFLRVVTRDFSRFERLRWRPPA